MKYFSALSGLYLLFFIPAVAAIDQSPVDAALEEEAVATLRRLVEINSHTFNRDGVNRVVERVTELDPLTGLDALEWAVKAVSLGAGEILLTSMDADGTLAYSVFQQGAGMVNAYDAVYSTASGCAIGSSG